MKIWIQTGLSVEQFIYMWPTLKLVSVTFGILTNAIYLFSPWIFVFVPISVEQWHPRKSFILSLMWCSDCYIGTVWSSAGCLTSIRRNTLTPSWEMGITLPTANVRKWDNFILLFPTEHKHLTIWNEDGIYTLPVLFIYILVSRQWKHSFL